MLVYISASQSQKRRVLSPTSLGIVSMHKVGGWRRTYA
jgi:hypothetical protein